MSSRSQLEMLENIINRLVDEEKKTPAELHIKDLEGIAKKMQGQIRSYLERDEREEKERERERENKEKEKKKEVKEE